MNGNNNAQNSSYTNANSIDEKNTVDGEAIVIEVEPLAEDKKDVKARINFLEMDMSSEFFKNPSTDDKGLNSETDETDEEDEDEQEETEELEIEEELKPSDFKEEAAFVLDIVDGMIQTMCYAISGEKDKGIFAIEVPKKNKLKRQLTFLLHKHRVKMSIEAMFCISFIAIYFEPIRQAISMKNDKKQKKQAFYENNKPIQTESENKYGKQAKKRTGSTSEAA